MLCSAVSGCSLSVQKLPATDGSPMLAMYPAFLPPCRPGSTALPIKLQWLIHLSITSPAPKASKGSTKWLRHVDFSVLLPGRPLAAYVCIIIAPLSPPAGLQHVLGEPGSDVIVTMHIVLRPPQPQKAAGKRGKVAAGAASIGWCCRRPRNCLPSRDLYGLLSPAFLPWP